MRVLVSVNELLCKCKRVLMSKKVLMSGGVGVHQC